MSPKATTLNIQQSESKQWGYSLNCNATSQRIKLPISFQNDDAAFALSVAITNTSPAACCDDLTLTDFRYHGNGKPLPNIRWIAVGKQTQWGTVTAGDYALPISFASNYSVVANDIGSAATSIKIEKKTNSIVNFYGAGGYYTPSVIFIAGGV